MRGWIAVPAVAVALAALPLFAQHGGGHFSGGGHGGFSGHAGGGSHSGGFGGMRSNPGFSSRSFSPSRPAFSRPTFSRQPFVHSGAPHSSMRPRSVVVGPGFRRGFGNCFGCRRFGFGWPWAFNGFYDPFWWWNTDSSYDDDRAREYALANDMNQQSLEEQSARQGDQDSYAGYSSAPSAAPDPAPEPPLPATVLVFKDQSKREISNYAIVGTTLWNFNGPRNERIPLSDLDLEATAEANEQRGVEFRLPVSARGQ